MAQIEAKQIDTADPAPSTDEEKHHVSPARRVALLAIVLVVVLGILIFGMRSSILAEAKLPRSVPAQLAVPSVSVTQPKPAPSSQESVLPGNIQPFISSPIFARTDGYLKKWYFDIGAHVKAGQLLATIQTPEVDDELAQARGALAAAQANLALSQITKDRYQELLKKHAVAQQDVDDAVGFYDAKKAVVDADMANVQRYAALVSFERIYAPFDGVITARNTDIGDLINSGSNTAPRSDLFHIAQTGTLRVYVNVPEDYSRGIARGEIADIVLAEFPGEKFPGKVVRSADAINMSTRTLLVEIDLKNPKGTLLTGSYAEVHLNIPVEVPTYLIPVSALIFRSSELQVGIVRDGKAVLTNVMPRHDLGNEIEIVNGLKANDEIIVNPPDSLVSGQTVQMVQAKLPGEVR
jgi:RND family efflux transporter MFP subunit